MTQNPSGDFWLQLATFEENSIALDRDADLTPLASVPLAFFVHRSVLTRTGSTRAHALWQGNNRLADTHPISRLVKLYLDHFGALATFTNLILEAESRAAPDPQRVVVLDLSGDTPSSISSPSGTVKLIAVSAELLDKLGVHEPLWKTIPSRLELPPNETTVNCRRLLTDLDRQLPISRVSIIELLGSAHGPFLMELVCYQEGITFDVLSKKFPDEIVLATVRLWLNAIRATFLFRYIGTTWYTAPVSAFFSNFICRSPYNVVCPLSSWSALTPSYDTDVAKALLAFVDENAKRVRSELTKQFRFVRNALLGHATATLPPLPRLPYLRAIAVDLIGSDHEGHPQSFDLLCCNSTEFVTWHTTDHDGASPKRWGIRVFKFLSDEDFFCDGLSADEVASTDHSPDAIGTDARERVKKSDTDAREQVKKSIQGNSLLLQQPGYLLWFGPVALGEFRYRPNAVVEIVGDRMTQVELQRALTEALDPSALIHVDETSANLYQKGRLTWSCQAKASPSDGGWKRNPAQGLSEQLLDLVKRVFPSMWCDDVAHRVRKVMSVAEEVARHRHGALFFLWHGEMRNDTVPLGLAWGWSGQDNYLELIDEHTLASLASLDGETIVDLGSGKYTVRQFTHPNRERHQTISLFDYRGHIEPSLRSLWTTPPLPKDKLWDLISMGTRHQKALRITYQQDNVIAVTVSSSGPIRIWHQGKPIYKGRA